MIQRKDYDIRCFVSAFEAQKKASRLQNLADIEAIKALEQRRRMNDQPGAAIKTFLNRGIVKISGFAFRDCN